MLSTLGAVETLSSLVRQTPVVFFVLMGLTMEAGKSPPLPPPLDSGPLDIRAPIAAVSR